ncbi:hypothetical protein RHMOL_Rhmol05G0131400 [Rhododendron molle]|uniref:Uncharacterized protein n=2 Tax=Rhododendron molle TaxID=49168 RepID=A0ACC0NNB9_RHOML|nr:hypothetical protein RHMOL_Rhmol05G0131400 [Rhododendron molle]
MRVSSSSLTSTMTASYLDMSCARHSSHSDSSRRTLATAREELAWLSDSPSSRSSTATGASS